MGTSVYEAYKLEIVHEHLCFDDFTLLQMYYKLRCLIREKEDCFRKTKECSDENNYLNQAVARLSYSFVKEELDNVYNEIEQRGLIITQ